MFEQKLRAIFIDTFEISDAEVVDDLTYTSIPLWDSIGHMALIAALDREFDVMLDTQDIIDMNSYKKTKEILTKHGGDVRMIQIDLSGKLAWVTGSTRGIGRAIAVRLAEAGATVVLSGRDRERLVSLQDEICSNTNTNPIIAVYDVGNFEEIKSAFMGFNKRSKQLDILVNNAGILESALLPMITPELLRKTLQVNTEATIFHMQYAARFMARNNSGSIINISSIMGRLGDFGQTAYAASKAAVIGASLSSSKELAPANIRVNVLAPGFIRTDMAQGISSCKYKDRISSIKMARIGEAEEVADSVVFLASDLSRYITGQVIGVDGGMVV